MAIRQPKSDWLKICDWRQLAAQIAETLWGKQSLEWVNPVETLADVCGTDAQFHVVTKPNLISPDAQ